MTNIQSQKRYPVKQKAQTQHCTHCHHAKPNKNKNLNNAVTLADIVQLVTVEKIEKRDADYLVHVQGHDTAIRLTLKELMSRRLFQLRVFEETHTAPFIRAGEIQWLVALSNALKKSSNQKARREGCYGC